MIVVVMSQNNMTDLIQLHTGFVQSRAEHIPIVFIAGIDQDIVISGLYQKAICHTEL
jgi:hypothetical protein